MFVTFTRTLCGNDEECLKKYCQSFDSKSFSVTSADVSEVSSQLCGKRNRKRATGKPVYNEHYIRWSSSLLGDMWFAGLPTKDVGNEICSSDNVGDFANDGHGFHNAINDMKLYSTVVLNGLCAYGYGIKGELIGDNDAAALLKLDLGYQMIHMFLQTNQDPAFRQYYCSAAPIKDGLQALGFNDNLLLAELCRKTYP